MNGKVFWILFLLSLGLGRGLHANRLNAEAPDIASVHRTVSQENQPQDSAYMAVQRFYTAYIGAWIADDGDTRAVLKQNLTRSFFDRLQRMYELELDYDPFLEAQDCDESVLEKLRIEKDTLREHVYRVHLWDSHHRNYKQIELLLEHTEQGYRIDDLLSLPDKYKKMR